MNEGQLTRCCLEHFLSIFLFLLLFLFSAPLSSEAVSDTSDHSGASSLHSSLSLSPSCALLVECYLVCCVLLACFFVVQRDNRVVWLEETDEWRIQSCTKRPPPRFIDVLMRLSWLPSEFVLCTVVGLQADRCTWALSTEKDIQSSL